MNKWVLTLLLLSITNFAFCNSIEVTCGQTVIRSYAGRILIVGDSVALSNTCSEGAGWQGQLQELLEIEHEFVGAWGTTEPDTVWLNEGGIYGGFISEGDVIDMHLGYYVKDYQTRNMAYGGGILAYGLPLSINEYCEDTSCVETYIPKPIRSNDVIIIINGSNDLHLYNQDHETILNGFDSFINYIDSYSSQITIIYVSILPRADNQSSINGENAALNETIKQYIKDRNKNNLYFLNAYDKFFNIIVTCGMYEQLYSDRAHLSDNGCSFLSKLIYDKMVEKRLTGNRRKRKESIKRLFESTRN